MKTVDIGRESDIIEAGSDVMALENQRYGRNKNTLINKAYIESGEYRRKFDKITDNPDVNKTLYNCAKTALKHRSGTVFEDMYWIDGIGGTVIHSVVDSTDEREIVYNDKIKNIVKNNHNIVTLHTHPGSMPPSIADMNSNCQNGYMLGVIACHDGKVFVYSSNELINAKLYDLYLGQFICEGYTEYEAQIKTLEKLKTSRNIIFKEVSDNAGMA